jgi:hypothetical protein
VCRSARAAAAAAASRAWLRFRVATFHLCALHTLCSTSSALKPQREQEQMRAVSGHTCGTVVHGATSKMAVHGQQQPRQAYFAGGEERRQACSCAGDDFALLTTRRARTSPKKTEASSRCTTSKRRDRVWSDRCEPTCGVGSSQWSNRPTSEVGCVNFDARATFASTNCEMLRGGARDLWLRTLIWTRAISSSSD